MIGKYFSEISETRTESLIEVFTQFVRSRYNIVGQEIYEIEARSKGHWFLINAHGVIEEGNLVRIWGSQRNISERKICNYYCSALNNGTGLMLKH